MLLTTYVESNSRSSTRSTSGRRRNGPCKRPGVGQQLAETSVSPILTVQIRGMGDMDTTGQIGDYGESGVILR